MMTQDQVTDHFKRAKKTQNQTPSGKSKGTGKKEETSLAKLPDDSDVSPQEQTLRAFDLTLKFGPCIGVTRMERWQRAEKWGLEPPQEVLEILNKYGPEDPANFSLWLGRV